MMRRKSIFVRAAAIGLTFAAGAVSGAEAQADGSSAPTVEISGAGELRLRPNPDLLRHLGVSLTGVADISGEWRIPLHPLLPLQVELGDGAPTRVRRGSVGSALQLVRAADGATSPALDLTPSPRKPLDWDLIDADGQVWLSITHGMRSPDMAADGVSLLTADARVGPALAAWSGRGEAGLPFANASLQLGLGPGQKWSALRSAQEKSCASPNWPGTPGFITDVILTNIDSVDVMRCRRTLSAGTCDGPGGDPGEVVYVPSATLRNSSEANASEVPWYTKFTGNFPPYGNDQHPFLVWNMYRIDAAGNLDQIAQSGLKHAFATANENCSEPCSNSHILGRGCSDLYNAFSNDFASALSPRAEVIPALGLWGRCGSVYDDGLDAQGMGTPGCNGLQDAAPQDDLYRHRLVVRETDIEPGLNPGAEYLIDAAYVVRDDQNIFNTMGSRTLQPSYSGGLWRVGTLGAFTPGAVIDRWLERSSVAVQTGRFDLVTPEGTVGIAVRATPLIDGRYRYDYAVMNFDFTRPVTAGAEPNLQIIRNLAISTLRVELANGAGTDSQAYRDGDADPLNDWTIATGPTAVEWSAPVGEHLEWGRLVGLSLVSPSPPGEAQFTFTVAEAGSPATYSVAALGPDGNKLFRSGFE